MDRLEELGYEKSDNHPEPTKPGEWTTQDCRYVEYRQFNPEKLTAETITFFPGDKNNLVWIFALNGGRACPAPLNIQEVETILEKLKEAENERNGL